MTETYWARTARLARYPWRLTYRFGEATAAAVGYSQALRESVRVIRGMTIHEVMPGSLRITVDREEAVHGMLYVIRARWTVPLVPELSRDVMPDGRRRYEHCDRCNYDRHECPGCGEPLSHNGLERERWGDTWRPHGDCTI